MGFIVRFLITAAALWLAVLLVPGITHDGTWLELLGVALVFGLVNAIVRPILFYLTCPLVFATLGLFVFVLNGLMLWLTAVVSAELGIGFRVEGIVPAILGALVVGVVSAVLSVFVGKRGKERRRD